MQTLPVDVSMLDVIHRMNEQQLRLRLWILLASWSEAADALEAISTPVGPER